MPPDIHSNGKKKEMYIQVLYNSLIEFFLVKHTLNLGHPLASIFTKELSFRGKDIRVIKRAMEDIPIY